jgi:DNA repair protein RAD50
LALIFLQTERQDKISKTERALEDLQSLPAAVRNLQSDIEDRKGRLLKLKAAVSSAKYNSRLADFAKKARELEDQRERLNSELQGLSLQADSRARLELKRGEVKSKTMEIQTM